MGVRASRTGENCPSGIMSRHVGERNVIKLRTRPGTLRGYTIGNAGCALAMVSSSALSVDAESVILGFFDHRLEGVEEGDGSLAVVAEGLEDELALFVVHVQNIDRAGETCCPKLGLTRRGSPM